ncbi:carbohydrate ABC transporter permease [Paenibacillus arenilitoris]|uniref:Carbohydrate ABC transporter permease n=1 Tax=Paenibacillus arenilitoris TaxID=2772299 RepID=A0A927CNK6_9BACL|nr:carbohydrate ABC transporter permease [Paenibacillus arenilitoris]MBD2870849.1 carbohydrate ABC transporter permease [Paenibacillus arenilitoris]
MVGGNNLKGIKIRESAADRAFLGMVYLLLAIVLIVILFPLLHIFSASFSSPAAVTSGKVWLWPVDFTLIGYKAVFQNSDIWIGFGNSLFYTVFGTLLNVAFTVAIAYPLARRTFAGRNLMMIFLVFTMFFDGGLIPNYLLVKSLGLLDTRWAMLLPGAFAVFQVIIARTFFQTTIPDELVEASQLDGCSDMKFFLKIVLPLSKPILAVLALMYAVGHWNTYFNALIYLSDNAKFPLQIFLRNLLILNSENTDMYVNIDADTVRQGLKDLLQYSLIVVASLPVLIIYPFVQKHFVKGVMIGSLKG